MQLYDYIRAAGSAALGKHHAHAETHQRAAHHAAEKLVIGRYYNARKSVYHKGGQHRREHRIAQELPAEFPYAYGKERYVYEQDQGAGRYLGGVADHYGNTGNASGGKSPWIKKYGYGYCVYKAAQSHYRIASELRSGLAFHIFSPLKTRKKYGLPPSAAHNTLNY